MPLVWRPFSGSLRPGRFPLPWKSSVLPSLPRCPKKTPAAQMDEQMRDHSVPLGAGLSKPLAYDFFRFLKRPHLLRKLFRLLEKFGVETAQGLKKPPKGILKKTTVNRYLKRWGYDFLSLDIEPASVRFQAKHSNDCWQFDLSPSDLKQLPEWPAWVENRKGRPTLMLYSLVDDRSGVAYQEYHVVFGEDVEAALRFLYRAMATKEIEGFPFQGIPLMIYTDIRSFLRGKLSPGQSQEIQEEMLAAGIPL